eukprot:SAG31_NODE_4511_length_3176_cov_5.171921_4_plen_91_part_00
MLPAVHKLISLDITGTILAMSAMRVHMVTTAQSLTFDVRVAAREDMMYYVYWYSRGGTFTGKPISPAGPADPGRCGGRRSCRCACRDGRS